MYAEITAAIVGAVVSQGFGYGLWKYRKKTEDVNQWYEDAISSVSYGLGICQSQQERSNLKYGDIAEESQKVTQRLKDHLNPHPSDIDEESILLVKRQEILFRKLSAASEASDEESALDSLEELFEMGQRDYENNPNVDVGEEITEATDRSPAMASIFKELSGTPRTYGSELENQLGKADSFQELLKSMNSEFGPSQKSVERLLESGFIDDDWDEGLSVGMRILLQITTNMCEEAINDLSETNNLNVAN